MHRTSSSPEMLIGVRLFSVDVVMNYASEEVGQKNPTEPPLFCLQDLALEGNSI